MLSIPQPRLFEVCFCVFVFFLFFLFSWFSSFLCFSLVCVILVRFKVKDAARIDTAFAKVFVSNSLCYCEFLVFLANSPQEAEARDFGNFEGVWARFMHTVLRIDYVLVFWKDLGLSAMGPQKLIKHMTSRPGSHRQRLRFGNGIERSASTERPLPGEACSNRAFCLDRTTTSWRGIFARRKNR